MWNQSPWKPEKMVVAALLRDCIFNPIGMQCQLSQQFLGKPGKKESQRRSREWSVWTASISNDLDLAADWWFLSSLLQQREQQGGLWSLRNLDPTLFALYVFTIAGTVTWALQVFKTVCIDTNSKQQMQRRCWDFVPLLVLICEDIPQIALTWIISSSFLDASGLAVFNLTTSIYSLFIQFFGECFLKVNGCCVMTEDDEDGHDADYDEENHYVAKSY